MARWEFIASLQGESTDVTESTPSSFDVLILGGGSGGYAAALRASQLGMTVGLVEESKVGGTCLHNGCIPTKALLHAAEVADESRHGPSIGVLSEFKGIDMPAVNAYKQGVIDRLYKGLQGLVKSRKVTMIDGHGTLVGPDAIEVRGVRYTGKNIVLGTGSYARSLPGLDIGGRVITSDQALEMDWVPETAIVLGVVVIWVEFGLVFYCFCMFLSVL